MRSRRFGGPATGVLVLILSCILGRVALASDADLPARVEAVLKTPGYKNAHWGLLVVDQATGEPVYEKNADQMFCPASVTKLYSCAAAMAGLGAEYRFETPVVRRGSVGKDGTLDGDLILVAKGDLSLGGRTGPDGTLLFEDGDHSYANGNYTAGLVKADPLAGLDQLARDVASSGIKRIQGEVLVDDRYFQPAPSSGSGPSWVSPIVVNDNVIDVLVEPGAAAGEPAKVKMVPETSFAAMDLHVRTTEAGTKPSIRVQTVGPRRFSVRGTIPVGHKPVVKIYEVEEQAAYARALFIECLRKRGVHVDASHLSHDRRESLPSKAEVARLPVVSKYTSPPLKEYVKIVLKVSQNLHASTLPMLLAAKHGQTTLDAGLLREGEALKSLGIDLSGVSFGGGAGGARADLVTPRATVSLLQAMTKRPEFPTFVAALPVLGRDGTLAKAVDPDSPARGHARAKTGTYSVGNGINGKSVLTSKALAGYMETASGRKLVFTFFVNNVPLGVSDDNTSDATTAAGRVLGKLCEVFYADAPATASAEKMP